MTMGANEVWLFRIVHQDTGKPAQGVPVTVLDRAGNAEGHWVSDADGGSAESVTNNEGSRMRQEEHARDDDFGGS